jgi:transposase
LGQPAHRGELGIARKTVQRYVRGATGETQTRPGARALTAEQHALAVKLFASTAEGNAVVVADLFAEHGVTVHPRTVQRVVQPHRRAKRAAEVATVRFETAPGHQPQIRFGEKWVCLGEQRSV